MIYLIFAVCKIFADCCLMILNQRCIRQRLQKNGPAFLPFSIFVLFQRYHVLYNKFYKKNYHLFR